MRELVVTENITIDAGAGWFDVQDDDARADMAEVEQPAPRMRLVEATPFRSGIVLLTYRPQDS
jgi:hypothetical protein